MSQEAMIQQLFEQQAGRFPDQVAVLDSTTHLTYHALENKANQFAHWLHERGVKAGDLIALELHDKSVNALIGLLGILKTGAAYVPIHPELPETIQKDIRGRVDFICSDSTSDPHALSMAHLESTLSRYPTTRPTIKGEKLPIHRAYVIYTSGTTGKAKGVSISHRNLLKTYASWESVYQLTPEDRHLQMARVSFDVFTGDWVRALCSGACLVLCSKEQLLSSEALYHLIQQEHITVAEFVPAVLRKLLHFLEEKQERLETFRLLICGSDLWTMKEYKKTQTFCAPQTRVINSYGLTEATIDSTYFELTEKNTHYFNDRDIVPIGIPFPHVSIQILNADNLPVKAGEIGTLYIGGGGLSEEGYLYQADLTKERFVDIDGLRFYHTGDQAVWAPDGSIAFLGRNELQTNIHGQRVDIAQIESVLSEHPHITQALVLPKETDHQTVELQAFLVSQHPDLQYVEFHSFLKDRLPPYAIPTEYSLIDRIPLTLHGKVDRTVARLPIQKALKPPIESTSNEIQEHLLTLWQETWKDRPIGIHTRFGELGGTSLEWAEMLRKIEAVFGVSFSLDRDKRTIHQMAKEIQTQRPRSSYGEISETTASPKKHIAIIGGGPAGVSVCQQLVQDLMERKEHHVVITLFEQGDTLGTGLPYSREEDCYILNLPTTVMQLGNEKAMPFAQWWETHRPPDQTTEFPPRHFFGAYIRNLLSSMKVKADQQGITLRYVPRTEVVTIQRTPQGDYTIISHCHTDKADQVVLCTGHMPSTTYRALLGTPGYQHDPWDKAAYHDLEESSDIGILGSRLTAIDIAMKLTSMGYSGRMHMFSRKGMLPTVLSRNIPPYPLKYLTLDHLNTLTKGGLKPLAPEALSDLFWQEISEAQGHSITWDNLIKSSDDQSPIDWLRHEIEQAEAGPKPWQQVLFALYPITPTIWSLLSFPDQKRFWEDYQSVFLTYLAAFPLDNAYQVLKLLESEQLQVHGGLTAVTPQDNYFSVTTHHQSFYLPRLFNGTGPGYHPGDVPLLHAMQKEGLIQKHHLGGINVDPITLAVTNRKGEVQPGLYAVGELTKGAYLATTDIGQVNTQADRVSYQIGAQIAKRTPYYYKPPISARCNSFFHPSRYHTASNTADPTTVLPFPRLFRPPPSSVATMSSRIGHSLQQGLRWASSRL